MDTKYCISCKQTKSITEFGKCRTWKDGLTVYCRDCTNRKGRQQKKLHPEQNRETQRRYMRKIRKTPQGRWCRLRDRANRESKSFEITLEQFSLWFEQEHKCHYCGQVLTTLNGSTTIDSLNIDRKDNEKGYALDNIVLACRRCNSIKGNWLTYQQMLEIAQKYFRL